jgi:hypothetical protein
MHKAYFLAYSSYDSWPTVVWIDFLHVRQYQFVFLKYDPVIIFSFMQFYVFIILYNIIFVKSESDLLNS